LRIATLLNCASVCSSRMLDPSAFRVRAGRAPGLFWREGGVDEDVGIKADHHRSCISSRVKVRGAAPQGSPCAITSIA
jgi:hypothetical protein